MSVALAVARLGLWGVLGIGLFLAADYWINRNRKERAHAENNESGNGDEPYLVNVAQNCSICYDRINDEEENINRRRILLPRCGHQLHKGCLDELRRTEHRKCPICRKRFD